VGQPSALSQEPWRRFLVGRSDAIERICSIVRLVGPRRSTVLITGQSGTGKEMVARALHMAGDRASHPLVCVNCAALPENLLEAELFGHVRGAFTGAMGQRTGRFEEAHRGTIFFDEIGDMPIDLQAKILRVLQEREFQRLGSSETIKVDVRVVAATNVDLAQRVRSGRFREDLYYRLNVVRVETPALSERPGDIEPLVQHFLRKICAAEQIAPRRITAEAVEHLTAYPWPGNVRQLENAVEAAIALCGERIVLDVRDFPLPEVWVEDRPSPEVAPQFHVPDQGLDFEQTVSALELSILRQALARTAGNKKLAADLLRLKRTTLAAKLRALGATA
jgi:DNA-binding NtrC family response regulator